MTLHDKIAALPEWPEDLAGYPPPDDAEWNDYLHEKIGCALARLALAREFMEMVIADGTDAEDGADCSCPWCSNARALLAAMEGPK